MMRHIEWLAPILLGAAIGITFVAAWTVIDGIWP